MTNPPAPSPGGALTSWTVDPVAIAVAAVAAIAYLAAVRRLRGRGEPWPVGCSASFGLGLVVFVAVTLGWVGCYAHTLFWARTLQVTLLLIVIPVFLAFGRPLALARRSLPPVGARRLDAVWGSRPMAALANPILGPLGVPVLASLVVFTSLWETSLRHDAVCELLNVFLLVAGLLIALPVVGEGVDPSSLSVALALFVGFIELLLDAVPGIVLRVRGDLIAHSYYVGLHRPWGPSLLGDQRLGGAILWIVGEVIDLPFVGILFVRWIRADEREAARVDRELDRRASRTAAVREPDDELPAVRDVPWWEVDGSVFGERRASVFRRTAARGDAGGGRRSDPA